MAYFKVCHACSRGTDDYKELMNMHENNGFVLTPFSISKVNPPSFSRYGKASPLNLDVSDNEVEEVFGYRCYRLEGISYLGAFFIDCCHN